LTNGSWCANAAKTFHIFRRARRLWLSGASIRSTRCCWTSRSRNDRARATHSGWEDAQLWETCKRTRCASGSRFSRASISRSGVVSRIHDQLTACEPRDIFFCVGVDRGRTFSVFYLARGRLLGRRGTKKKRVKYRGKPLARPTRPSLLEFAVSIRWIGVFSPVIRIDMEL